MALSASGTHAPLLLLFILSTLSPGPRWLSALQPWCLHSRQHDGGRKTGKNVRERPSCLSTHSAAFSSKIFAYISSARIQSHSCTFTAYFLSCPNGRRGRGVVLLLLYLPGQPMASDDFAIHFYFQAVPTTEEINRAMLSGTPADSWLPPTESPHSWTGCSPLFCMPHGTYSK